MAHHTKLTARRRPRGDVLYMNSYILLSGNNAISSVNPYINLIIDTLVSKQCYIQHELILKR